MNTEPTTGPACGNNPNVRLTDGDRQAVAEFRAYLADRAALLEQIADVLAEADGWTWAPGFDRRRSPAYQAYLTRADRVVGLLAAHDTTRADARVRALHQQYTFGTDPQDYCAHCNQISGGWIPWPCPTVQALDAAGAQQPEPETSERPRCPHCQMPHDLTPGVELACASIRASIRDAGAQQQPTTETPRVAAYRSPGTRALYCLTCARQETGWQHIAAAEMDEQAVCDFCGSRILATASRTLGEAVARYLPESEDPARIDRLRPEFTEHSSVEAIDAQLQRARAQQRRWHLRAEWLVSLRADRVARMERGEWPAGEPAPVVSPVEAAERGEQRP